MGLDIRERRAYVNLLARRIEEENEAMEALQEKLRKGWTS